MFYNETQLINFKNLGMGAWLKWESAYLLSTKPWFQIPVPQKNFLKSSNKNTLKTTEDFMWSYSDTYLRSNTFIKSVNLDLIPYK
jgi:hypothetical protein